MPLLVLAIIPKAKHVKELTTLLKYGDEVQQVISIQDEAESYKLPIKAVSDLLNNSMILQWSIAAMGSCYVVSNF